MIELAIKMRWSASPAWMRIRFYCRTRSEGATFQRISDPEMVSGTLRTGIVSARIRVNLYRVDDYTSLLQLDKNLVGMGSQSFMASWMGILVQYGAWWYPQDKTTLTNRISSTA